MLQSKREPRGGFFLSRKTDEITLLDILEAIDGLVSNDLRLATQTNDEAFSKKIEDVCRQATNHVKQTYEQASLADILAE